MSTKTDYYSLQGRVSFAVRQSDGSPGPVVWAQNVPKFELTLETSEESSKESHSGKRMKDFVMSIENTLKTSYTLDGLTLDNLAAAFWSDKLTLSAGTASGEELPTLAVGDYFQLDHQNTSSWSLVDSTGTPVTLGEGTHYSITSAFAGQGQIISVAGLTQPIKASYSYSESNAFSLMSERADELHLFFDGVDTVSGRKCFLHIPRHSAMPVKSFSLINNEGKGSMEFEGEALYDGSDATYPLGKFVLQPAV